jgi:hypothetical protein
MIRGRRGASGFGYASTAVLDTTNTVWDSTRVLCLQASDTRWAVVDPPLFVAVTV